jgi:hypothetical protein
MVVDNEQLRYVRGSEKGALMNAGKPPAVFGWCMLGAVVLRVRRPGTALGVSLKLVALRTSWREARVVHILINLHVLLHISEVLLRNCVHIFHDDAT